MQEHFYSCMVFFMSLFVICIVPWKLVSCTALSVFCDAALEDRCQIIDELAFFLVNGYDLAVLDVDCQDAVVDRIFLTCDCMCQDDLSLALIDHWNDFGDNLITFNCLVVEFYVVEVADYLPPLFGRVGGCDGQ